MSSILASELSREELMEIRHRFTSDMGLASAMVASLDAAIFALEATRQFEYRSTPEPAAVSLAPHRAAQSEEAAYELIKRRRLSKDKVLRTMTMAGHRNRLPLSVEHLTLRELLSAFFVSSTPEEQDRLVELLDHAASKDDAFLQGILRGR
jgi:hypothetical protein